MITLASMTQAELDEYLHEATQALADELVRAHNWPIEKSLAAAIQSFDAALPRRTIETPGQFLRTILADGRKVGILWYGIRSPQEAFIWDVLIYPQWRGKGYAGEALALMEGELLDMNVTSVTLSVFAHNFSAARLYSKAGYAPVLTRMNKQLG